MLFAWSDTCFKFLSILCLLLLLLLYSMAGLDKQVAAIRITAPSYICMYVYMCKYIFVCANSFTLYIQV